MKKLGNMTPLKETDKVLIIGQDETEICETIDKEFRKKVSSKAG